MTTETKDIQKEELSDIKLQIDCAPGTARPDTILLIILQQVPNLTTGDFVQTGAFFGEWTFTLKKGKESIYNEHKKIIGQQLKMLNEEGAIRYASW